MSNYCGNCSYQVSKKNGDKACPFNYLYWDFMARNRDKLQGNPRISRIYSTYDRMADDKKQAITEDAERFFKGL
jgi:deoxyribodipyrimidine photolyase-related protein